MKLQATSWLIARRPFRFHRNFIAYRFKRPATCDLRPASNKGFTLVEILIALAISALILSIIYASYASTISTIRHTEERSNAFSLVRMTLNRMSNELTSSFLSENNENLVFVGEEGRVDFISSSHERIFKNRKEYDLSEIGYFAETDEESGTLSLLRREDLTPDDEPLEGGEEERIIRGLEELKFGYYGDEEWHSEWDSRESKTLPQAVKVTLKFPEKEFSTAVYLPLAMGEKVE